MSYNRLLFGISPSFISCVDGILWCKNDIVMSSLNLLFFGVIFKLPNIDGPLCRLFFVHPKEMSLYNFLSEKAEKTWGKTGQNWWRGDFFCSAY